MSKYYNDPGWMQSPAVFSISFLEIYLQYACVVLISVNEKNDNRYLR